MSEDCKASVIKKLGIPFYEVVLSDYWFTKVIETLGYFNDSEEAETFASLWNRMLSTDDVAEYQTRKFEED